MSVAEITPLVVDPLPASHAADRARAVVPDMPPSTQSASTASSVDGSSTEADAGAALSAFLVQMGSVASTISVRSATEVDNPPNDTEGFERPLAEAMQVPMLNGPTPPLGDQTISLFADPRDAAAPRSTDVVTGAANDPVTSAIAVEQTSESSSQPALSPEVDGAFIVDDSSTAADAGAALSAFLIQIRSSSSDAPPSSLETSREPNSDRGSDLRSPEVTPTASRIPGPVGSPDISATATSSASDAPGFGPSNDAADLTSDAVRSVIGPPAAEPKSDVNGEPVSVPPEAGGTSNADSRAAEAETEPSSLSLQTRAHLSEAAAAPGNDVQGDRQGVDVGFAEAPRAPLPTAATPAFEGRPVDTSSGARHALTAGDNKSAPAESFVAGRNMAEVAIAALQRSNLIRLAGTATATSTSGSTGTEDKSALPALPMPVSNDPSLRPGTGRGAEPSRSGDRLSPDASQAPTAPPTRSGAAIVDTPARDGSDAAVLSSHLLAAGLITLVPSLTPIRPSKDGHHVPASRVAPAAPVLASGSATSAHTGAGQDLLKHAQTAYAGEAGAAEVGEPSGESV